MSSAPFFPQTPMRPERTKASSSLSGKSAPNARLRHTRPDTITALGIKAQGEAMALALLANSIHAAWMDGDETIPSYIRPRHSLGCGVDFASVNLVNSLDNLAKRFPAHTLSPKLVKAMATLDSEEELAKLSQEAKELVFRETVSHAYHLTLRLCQVFWMAEMRCGSELMGMKPAQAAKAIASDLHAEVEAILAAGAVYQG